MIIKILKERIHYDGSQLMPGWAERFGIYGSSLIAFRGSMNVKPEFMCDLKDLREGKKIKGDDLLHFRFEFFDNPDLELAYTRQRLFATIVKEYLEQEFGIAIRRVGSDLYVNGGKLTVSVATRAKKSSLIHFAINVSVKGTPSEISCTSLCDFVNLSDSDLYNIMNRLLKKYAEELEDVKIDVSKSRLLDSFNHKFKEKRTKLELLNPEEVYTALTSNPEVIEWLTFISNHYDPPKKRVLLIFPCTTTKPYTKSRSYKALFKTLSALKEKREYIHLMTISEPFGLIPEEFHDEKNWDYDCPGLFKWWCNRNGQPFSKEKLDRCIEILAQYIAEFLKRAHRKKCYSKIVAFVRTYTSQLKRKDDHTHRRIIEEAAKIAGVKVNILPSKRLVSKIVKEKGPFAWDMYGVAHPIAQNYLLNYLRRLLNDN